MLEFSGIAKEETTLLRNEGFSGMTIEAIAKKANVSVPSVYAIFKSKTGILTALLDESMFGSDY